MHVEIFYPPQKKAFHVFEQKTDLIKKYHFFLAGGTALALQIGHRRSFDFDFFSALEFDPQVLMKEILGMFPGSELKKKGKNTLTIFWKKVQLSFFGGITIHHLKPSIFTKAFPMFSISDIAAMKIAAMLQRTAMRDYFDLAFLLQTKELSLHEMIKGFYEKYGEQGKTYPESFLCRTLSYVHDLPADHIPILLSRDFWKGGQLKEKMKKIFEKNIEEYFKKK